jgi:hypothetical protein
MERVDFPKNNLPSPLVGDEGVNNQALSGSFSDNSGRQ